MKMKNLEVRQLTELTKAENNIIEGYAVKFGTQSRDLGGFIETVNRDAFDGVDLSDVRMFIQHDSSKLLARTASGTLELNIDDVGLHFRAHLPNTTLGNDAFEMIKRGDLNQCSFGFTVREDSWTKSNDIMYRSIDKVGQLFEISLVAIPAYDDTDVTVASRSLENIKNDLRAKELSLELDLLGL